MSQQWKKWQRQFPWLKGTPERARCSQCPNFECPVYQRCQLTQHEKSKTHLSAGGSSCPTSTEFDQVINERCKGTSLRRSHRGPHQSAKMLWCLSEAVKDLVKKQVRQGILSASISQDSQGSTIGVRLCVVALHRV